MRGPDDPTESPLSDFSSEDIDRVGAEVQEAEKALEEALEILDGEGGHIRERLATARGEVGLAEVAVRGCLSMKIDEEVEAER